MRLNTFPRRAPAVRRAGVTLIEVLVVMSIIATLIGVGIGATMRFRETATNRAAEDQLKQLQIALNDQYGAVVSKCAKEPVPDAVLVFCGGDQDRARAVHTAATLRVHLPESFTEATSSFSVGTQVYNNPPRGAFKQVNGSTGLVADQQAAVLLYLILSEQAVGLGNGEVRATESSVKDTSATPKQLKVFSDPWGTPIRFSRWAQSAELDAAPYAHAAPSGGIDPLDPKKLVVTPTTTWLASSITTLNASPSNLMFVNRNRVPSVVSSGKDKNYAAFAAGADDLVGYRLNRFGNQGK